MVKEDALRFAEERLRLHPATALTRELRLGHVRRVTRRLAAEMGKGEHRTFERVDRSVLVMCNRGSLWITHDGDPRDVILYGGETYQADREEAMHVFALQDCLLEIQFDDDVTEH
ncbi:MAG TPA: DUF2917 domain-containing protein [Ramlibacter sp.]|uniref:DUF2917 domain-containing protein n=1 Tax=Ramlibacter sp. TaxID=1917967 RepID=UPI002ED05D6A